MRTVKTPEGASRFCFNVAQPAAAPIAAQEISARKNAADVSIVLMRSKNACEQFYMRLGAFLKLAHNDIRVRVLPEISETSGSDAERFDSYCERVGTLNAMSVAGAGAPPCVVLATPQALFSNAPKPDASEFLLIKKGDSIAIEKLRETLVKFGYYNEVLCEAPGQFALRGGIIDVYPLSASSPLRIDFFGDEVDEIRTFDPNTQLSDGRARELRIDSASALEDAPQAPAFEYLRGKKISWILLEPAVLAQENTELFYVPDEGKAPYKNFSTLFAEDFSKSDFLGLSLLDSHAGILTALGKPNFLRKTFPNTARLRAWRASATRLTRRRASCAAGSCRGLRTGTGAALK